MNYFSIYTIVIITQLKKWLDLTIKIKIKIMANSQEIFEQIKELYTQFENEHNGTTKAAKVELEKLLVRLKN